MDESLMERRRVSDEGPTGCKTLSGEKNRRDANTILV